MNEVIPELALALAQCRAHIGLGVPKDQTLKHLREAVSKIEQALELVKSIE